VNCPLFSSVYSFVLKFVTRLVSYKAGPPVSGSPSIAAASRLAVLKIASLYFSSVASTAAAHAAAACLIQLGWLTRDARLFERY